MTLVSWLCLLACLATTPATWRLCFPPFPVVRAADPIAPEVPVASFDYGGLV